MAIRRYWQDEPDGGVTVITEQDVDLIVDWARVLRSQHGPGWKGDFHQVATIPMSIFMELHRKGITDDQRAMRKWMNNPDHAVFRTRSGRI